ncbi:MAG: acyltransferase [Flavobacteriales bacterium]|nr:acyltransferase [Flavobacteriales bacterium]
MGLTTDTHRVFGLDLVRAVAIILVVLGHGGFLLNGSALDGFPYFRMIDGVDMFFVLSGFLIGGILVKQAEGTVQFKGRQLLRFWKRRWFRTLPNYYLVLVLNVFVVMTGIIHEDQSRISWKFAVFLQNFSTPMHGFFWESWSLPVEEWFYIFTPLLLLFLLKGLTPKRALLFSALSLLVLPVLYRISIFDPKIDEFWWDVTFRKTVLCRLDSIGFGVLAAWMAFYVPHWWSKARIPAFLLGALLILFLVNHQEPVGTVYRQVVMFSLVPFSVMLLLPAMEGLKLGHGLAAVAVQHISKISYSMYLINLALVAEVIRDNFPPQNGPDGILKYGIFWVVVLAGSSLLYRYFEKPVMDLRDR